MRAFASAIGVLAVLCAGCNASTRSVTAGFWFEPTSYKSAAIGTMTADDLVTIDAIARSELRDAFRGLNIVLSDRRDAPYRISVIQDIRDDRLKRQMSVAGASRAVAGFGGSGAVSLAYLAAAAEVYAPEGASRATIIDAIGRGIGRVAVHEFTHLFLPDAPLPRQPRPGHLRVRRRQSTRAVLWDTALGLRRSVATSAVRDAQQVTAAAPVRCRGVLDCICP